MTVNVQASFNLIKSSIANSVFNVDKSFWENLVLETEELLKIAQKSNNEDLANKLWFLNVFAENRVGYLKCWDKMVSGDFKEAWCQFEIIEHGIDRLRRNLFLEGYGPLLEATAYNISQWQELFPYNLFMSPEFLIKSRKCSICSTPRSPWTDCGHETLKVYMGEMCFDQITDVEILSMSLVTNPVQKYSILEAQSDNKSNSIDYEKFKAVVFARTTLPSPFAPFEVLKTTRLNPHDQFPKLKEGDLCLCQSGRAYGECCQLNEGIRLPHIQLIIGTPP